MLFFKGDPTDKWHKLLSSVSLFALVWGFLGNLIGLIGAFDAISVSKGVSSAVLAGGLKVGLLFPVFGIFVFFDCSNRNYCFYLKEKINRILIVDKNTYSELKKEWVFLYL